MPLSLPKLESAQSVPALDEPIRGTSYRCAAGEFHAKRLKLESGPSANVEMLLVQSDRVRAAFCPTRGFSLWKANIDGVDCGWKSPVEGPIHPSLVKLSDPNGLGWLDGFDELLVRCGLQSFGAPDFGKDGELLFPLHGRVGNLPARNLQISVDEEHSMLELTADVHETRFLQFNLRLQVKYILSMGEPSIRIQDKVRNAGDTPSTCQLLYHINVGQPILAEGCQASVAAERCVARNAHAASDIATWRTYKGPTPGYAEQVYFFAGKPDSEGWSQALLENNAKDVGFAVHYKTETLPYFTQWKNTVGENDGYVTGLEPGTGFPNPRSFEEEQGRLVKLAAGEEREFDLKLELLKGEAVSAMASRIEAHATQGMPTQESDAKWCAD